jgi:hypothetical protein
MPAQQIHAQRLLHPQSGSSGDWTSLLQMVPLTVRLFTPGTLTRHGFTLASNACNSKRFLAVLTATQADLRAANVPVIAKMNREPRDLLRLDDLTRPQRRWLGQVALELYFTQIFRSEAVIVDLWPSRFGVDRFGDAAWYPRPVFARWDSSFVQALRAVYAGFFLGDDQRFHEGLNEMGLGSSAELLLGHLGEGNQRSVRFRSDQLKSTLRAISVVRRSGDDTLHHNFITFGLLLGALHALLESLNLSFNVRSAFMRSYPGS